MKQVVLILALAGLAGCGADGEPDTPEAPRSAGGTPVTLSGAATFGVVRGPANMPRRP